MSYRVYLILFVIYLGTIASAQAQDNTRYRVELLVLNHINHSEEPREARYLEDFSPALDLLEPPEEEEAAETDVHGSLPGPRRRSVHVLPPGHGGSAFAFPWGLR